MVGILQFFTVMKMYVLIYVYTIFESYIHIYPTAEPRRRTGDARYVIGQIQVLYRPYFQVQPYASCVRIPYTHLSSLKPHARFSLECGKTSMNDDDEDSMLAYAKI